MARALTCHGSNEDDGLQMAFLDGNQPDRLCEPMKKHIEARGGEVRSPAGLRGCRSVACLRCM